MARSTKDIWLFFLLIYFSISCWKLKAQDSSLQPIFNFEVFELPGGELGNYVQAIAQDSFGFMWFGTQFGLYRWDGYQFKTYMNNLEDSNSIASNYVESIYVAKDGTLWLGHLGEGLDRFDYETEAFQHYNLNLGDDNNTGSNSIIEMTEDRDGNLWMGTHYGVFRLDIKTGNFKQFLHDPNNVNSLSFNMCRTLLVDSEGTLWLGTGFPWTRKTDGGLNRYRPETEDFVSFLHDPADPNSLINNKVSEIFEDSKGNFWVGTVGDGLHLMDRKTGKFQRLQRDPDNPNQLCSPFVDENPFLHIRFILEDQNHKLWIGAAGGGIKYYDRETGYMKDYFYEENDPQSLPGSNPWKMFQSRDGTFWACTNGFNGNIFKFKETSFEYYPSATNSNTVYSFCESKDQKLWIGNDESGLLQFDSRSKEQTSFDLRPRVTNLDKTALQKNSLDESNLLNFFLKMVEDKEGHLWTRKYHPPGLFRLDPETGEIKFYQNDPEDENSIGRGGVTDILRDEKDRIWAVTSSGDLNLYDPEGDRFIKYKFAIPKNKDASLEFYTLMAPAAGGKIWLVGTGRAKEQMPPILTKFDPATGEFDPINDAVSADDLILKYEIIQGVQEDKLGNLWVCSDTQLKKINPNTGESKHFRAADFGSLYFKGMTMDDRGRLWLFGDKISMLDPLSGNKFSFVATFYVQPSANYTEYVFKDSKGFIYFGGKGGFQKLDPRKVGNADATPPTETVIKDFEFLYQADDNEGEKDQPIHILTTDKIRLRHDQNAFTFHFAALAFQHPESNRHEFKLEGYDEQWRSTGLEPTATYVKVPPGDYTFKVRGATLRSEWGVENTVRIHISPPWWGTWWAYTFYTLLVLGLLYTFYYFHLNRKLDKAEAHRLKELDNVKTRLYTNITHEFRTPLTVILGTTQQVLDNPKEHFKQGLEMVIRNGNNLLSLVNQMLDLSKLESGKMALQLQQSDIINYLKYIVESFHSFAESKQVQMHFHSEEEDLMMDIDHEKIQQIMSNLLSNAVKFTPEGGLVYVTVGRSNLANPSTQKAGSSNLKIQIRDTGLGIHEEQLPYIFDRFYQVDDTPTRHGEGTGIGLALVKELIKLMGGEISVESKLDKGTEFTLMLPIKNDAPIAATPAPVGKPFVSPVLTSESTPFAPTNIESTEVEQNLSTLESSSHLPQILLIEDNPDVVTYIASCLQKDYQIKIGINGQEGIDIALENIPDLIITDVMMPYKDGFEVCSELKKDERTSHIPIIMLTAKADIESKLEGLERGADAYLAKPFNKKELQLRIKKLLELRQNLQQHYLQVAGLTEGAVVIKNIPDVAEVEDNFVKKARQTVEAHIDDFDFNVESLCKAMNLSHSQLHRKLTALTGYSVQKFIRYIRLTKAKELLKDPELSITAVAFDSGFSDPNYFGRVFRQEFGVTPSQWREQMVM